MVEKEPRAHTDVQVVRGDVAIIESKQARRRASPKESVRKTENSPIIHRQDGFGINRLGRVHVVIVTRSFHVAIEQIVPGEYCRPPQITHYSRSQPESYDGAFMTDESSRVLPHPRSAGCARDSRLEYGFAHSPGSLVKSRWTASPIWSDVFGRRLSQPATELVDDFAAAPLSGVHSYRCDR